MFSGFAPEIVRGVAEARRKELLAGNIVVAPPAPAPRGGAREAPLMAREDFQIIGSKPIGRGAFGTVFAARRISDDAPVALKIVLHSGEWGPERIEAERKGAILQQRFAQTHGMVPEVYDCGPDGDDFYIAMEFVDGPSLEEPAAAGGPLSPRRRPDTRSGCAASSRRRTRSRASSRASPTASCTPT